MTYNPDIDHRRSTRLPTWDYRDAGAYFATICTNDRASLFGRFVGDDLVLNRFAAAIEECWDAIPSHFPASGTDAFVVMPNHVHGIVWIQREPIVAPAPTVGARHASPLRPDYAQRHVGRPHGAPSASLGAIVGSFKSAAAKRINHLRNTPGAAVWQRGFHDRIIRNERELNAVRQCILDNPRKWAEDKHNPAVFRKRA